MEKLTLFGENNELLVNVIANQIQYNNTLNAEHLYDEIVTKINTIKNYSIITTEEYMTIKLPNKIYKSLNFQYILQDGFLIICNKYY